MVIIIVVTTGYLNDFALTEELRSTKLPQKAAASKNTLAHAGVKCIQWQSNSIFRKINPCREITVGQRKAKNSQQLFAIIHLLHMSSYARFNCTLETELLQVLGKNSQLWLRHA